MSRRKGEVSVTVSDDGRGFLADRRVAPDGDGRMDVRTEPGRGADITLTVPLQQGKARYQGHAARNLMVR